MAILKPPVPRFMPCQTSFSNRRAGEGAKQQHNSTTAQKKMAKQSQKESLWNSMRVNNREAEGARERGMRVGEKAAQLIAGPKSKNQTNRNRNVLCLIKFNYEKYTKIFRSQKKEGEVGKKTSKIHCEKDLKDKQIEEGLKR